jgi:hypothetical protein
MAQEVAIYFPLIDSDPISKNEKYTQESFYSQSYNIGRTIVF